jgi:hypothetical protein
MGGMTADSFGNLFGIAGDGGAHGLGAIYEITDSDFVVPEPGSLALLAVLAPTMMLRRRRGEN